MIIIFAYYLLFVYGQSINPLLSDKNITQIQPKPLENTYVQISETDPAFLVLLHRPGTEVFYGGLHPSGHLFEETSKISATTAKEAHINFANAIREAGVQVEIMEDVVSRDHEKLVKAAKSLIYQNITSITRPDLLEESYKQLDHFTNSELFNVILLQPTVVLGESDMNSPVKVEFTKIQPLSNVVFTRDQQITTAKGLVLGNLNSPQRSKETELLELTWEILGVPIIGKVKTPAYLEGGDFIPVSSDLCLIGVGLRTNQEAIDYLLENDLFGTRRVGIVLDEKDKNQDRMHLDTVFNIVDSHRAVVLEDIIGEDSPIHRIVKEYIKGQDGKYHLQAESLEFSKYLEKENFQIIKITQKQQLSYIGNFLNLGPVGKHKDGIIISVHPELEDLLKKNGYAGTVKYVNYRGVTQMYGAAHCSSQVFRKKFKIIYK